MTVLEKACGELRELGYEPRTVRPDGFAYDLALFDYPVDTGRYKGRCLRVGIGFQENAYPEYPPHWVCVAGLSDAQIPTHSSFRYDDADWAVFSVPPNDFWDGLPSSSKNMKTYVRRHLMRFWSQV